MIFLNPIMLAGVAGAVLPLVLHFLSRARYRNVDWGGMMFLDPSRARRHHGSRVKEMSLLLLRMAIVALLAIALSRPVVGNGPQQTAMVVLLDRSSSLDVEENGPPRLESARRAAVAALSALQPGDEAALQFMPETIQPLATPQFTTDLQSLVVRVNDARSNPTPGALADVGDGLTAAAHLLERSRAPNRQIVMVCDRQDVNWRDVTEPFTAAWQRSVTDSSGRMPQFNVIPVGGVDAGNVAVESVQILNPPVIRDVPVDLEVKVHNYDTIPSPSLALTILTSAPNREIDRAPLNLPAGGTGTMHFSVRMSQMHQQTITAKIIPQSGMSFDDSLDTIVDVEDPIGVLVVTGEEPLPKPASFRTAAELIHLALAPREASGLAGASNLAKVQVMQSDDWPQLDPSRYRVVVLANAPRISSSQAQRLEEYLYNGGGVLVAPGNLVRADEYNRQLWAGGAGILPAELDPPTAADGSQATSLLGLDFAHPIFHFLKDRAEPLPKVTIGRYFPAHTTQPRSKVIGRYASGQPFLIESSFGRGRVLLLTTSLDAEWSTLASTGTYLPLLQSAVRYLVCGSEVDRNLMMGQPITAAFEGLTKPLVSLFIPQQGRTLLQPVRVGDGYEVSYQNTNRPGLFRLEIDWARERWNYTYIVRPPRDESDLSSLSPAKIQQLSRWLNIQWVDADPQSIQSAVTRSLKPRELWPYLIAAVIALGLLELVMQRVWLVPAEKGAVTT